MTAPVLLAAAAAPAVVIPHPSGWNGESIALVLSIIALFLCTVGFAVTTAVLRYRNRRTGHAWTAREAKWETPLLEVLAGEQEPPHLWRSVDEGEELYFVDYLLRFARRVRGVTRTRLGVIAAPYLGPIAARIAGGDAERRARAVETVAQLGFDRYSERIVAAMEDPSPLVTMVATRSLARGQRPEHVPILLSHLSRLKEWSPRQLAAILASIGVEGIPSFRQAYGSVAYPPALRAVAADALRQLHDPEAPDLAIAVIGSERDRDLVAASLRLITELGRPEHAIAVRSLCGNEDPVIRATALQALAATGGPADHGVLRNGLRDGSSWVAIQAARALLETGGSDTLRALARGEGARARLAQQVLMERR